MDFANSRYLPRSISLPTGKSESPQGFGDLFHGEDMPFSVTWQTLLDPKVTRRRPKKFRQSVDTGYSI